MFESEIDHVRMRSVSTLSYDFWKNSYKPTMDRIKRRIASTPMSIGIWVPRLEGMGRIHLYEIINDLNNIDIKTTFWIGDEKGSDFTKAMEGMEALCKGEGECIQTVGNTAPKEEALSPEIIFCILLSKTFDLKLFLNVSQEAALKLYIFYNASIEFEYKKNNPNFNFKDIYPKSLPIHYPEDFKSRAFIHRFNKYVDALRRAKYLQSLIPEKDRPLRSKKNIFSFYEDFKCRIDTFQSSGHHYFISFIRFLSNPTIEALDEHLDAEIDIGILCKYFQKNRLIEISSENRLTLTYPGNKYFKMLGLDSLPILSREKHRFKERWRNALKSAYYTRHELFKNTNELSKLSDQLYSSLAKKLHISRAFRYAVNRFIRDWLTEEEKNFLAHPWSDKLFKIWRENIAGHKRVWRSGSRDRISFLEYMFRKFEIHHHPKNADIFVNHKNLAFNHTMIRPNSYSHFYVIFSFEVRPMKKMIRQYFDLAAITGQYDLIFRRFHPYHFLLKLHARPGERTSFDMRNYLDWKPMTFKMDTTFTVPVGLDKVRTRQRDRFIAIPVVRDEEAEARKEAEITALEKQISGIKRDLFINYDFSEDGRIITTGDDGPEVIDNFMGKRSNFFQTFDELNLLKAMPRPARQSGLIIRFNLMDPIAVLINGINRNRDLYLDEMRHLSKCMSLLSRADIESLDAIIDEVFNNPQNEGLSEETYDLLNDLERIEKEEHSEDEAWAYLTSRFIHGKHHALLQTICHRLSDDGFEVLFSLFPLLTGRELKIDEKVGPKETRMASVAENKIPLVEYLKRDLSDLLKTVFTRCIDISGATKRLQSEARLALIIVKHCLNVKSQLAEFKRDLEQHLKKHYETHLSFLKEHLGESELFKYIHKIGIEVDEMIENDLAEIVRLTQACQKRLFSRANNNRLLCFIDPDSVEVQIGDFEYSGDAIQSELEYIHKKEERQRELAEKQQAHDAEIREHKMEKHAAIEKGQIEKDKEQARINKVKAIREMNLKDEKEKVRAEEEKEAQIARSRKAISKFKLEQIAGETEYLAAEALKQGNMKNYAILSLLEAHRGNGFISGMEGVEKLLEESPNLLFTIAPEIYEARHVHKLKDTLLENLDSVMNTLDPITLSTLFSKDYDELIKSDYYKSIVKVMSETLKHVGFRNRAVVEQVFDDSRSGKKK